MIPQPNLLEDFINYLMALWEFPKTLKLKILILIWMKMMKKKLLNKNLLKSLLQKLLLKLNLKNLKKRKLKLKMIYEQRVGILIVEFFKHLIFYIDIFFNNIFHPFFIILHKYLYLLYIS